VQARILSFKPMEEYSNRRDTHIIMYHHVSSCSDLRPFSPISCANMWPVLLRRCSGGGEYARILSFKPMEECCCRFGLSFEPPRHAYHHVSSCLCCCCCLLLAACCLPLAACRLLLAACCLLLAAAAACCLLLAACCLPLAACCLLLAACCLLLAAASACCLLLAAASACCLMHTLSSFTH
jgi:hypothetical protein